MMSPLGQVPQRRPPRRRRRRRAWPLVAFVLIFAVAAAGVWWRIFTDDTSSTHGAACSASQSVPADLSPHDIPIRVYNATNRSGLAGTVTTGLRQRGFDVIATANDPTGRTVTGIAEIRYGSVGAPAARLVAAVVPGATLVSDHRTSAAVDIALGPKFHSLATPGAMREAVKRLRATPTATPSGC